VSGELGRVEKKFADPSWKMRKEGLEDLQRLLYSVNYKIKPDNLGEVAMMLKPRLLDAHKTLVRSFLMFAGALALKCRREIAPHSKPLMQKIIANFSDKQSLIRADAIASLDDFAGAIGLDPVVSCLAPFLLEESAELRKTILKWLLSNEEGLRDCQLKPLIAPALNCLIDKNKEIRSAAEELV